MGVILATAKARFCVFTDSSLKKCYWCQVDVKFQTLIFYYII